MNSFKLYTDGSYFHTPSTSIGGWGAVTLTPEGHIKSIKTSSKPNTDINRAELESIVRSLEEHASKDSIEVYTDSAYVVLPINEGHLEYWSKNNWHSKKGARIKNHDLWSRLLKQLKTKNVSVKKVKSHSGELWNEVSHNIAKGFVQNKIKRASDFN